MALNPYPSLQTKTFDAANAGALDTAIIAQIATLNANQTPTPQVGLVNGLGTKTIIAGSIAIAGYSAYADKDGNDHYTALLQWQEYLTAV